MSPAISGCSIEIAALKFVQRQYRGVRRRSGQRHGGAGQSAGAASIAILMTMPLAAGLFRRAILQSTPFGRPARTLEDSHRIGPAAARRCWAFRPMILKSLPFAKLVAAQGEVGRLGRNSPTRRRRSGR